VFQQWPWSPLLQQHVPAMTLGYPGCKVPRKKYGRQTSMGQ
jgi:hypothetical protein